MKLARSFAVLLVLLMSGGCFSGTRPVGQYGTRVAYKKDRTIQFPDFQLTFIGKRRVFPPHYSRGFLLYDFRLVAAGKVSTVSWTAGTGIIAPSPFQVGGRHYLIEREHSGTLGALKENELVVTVAAP